MLLKAFQLVLVTCVVIFTAAMLVLVAYALLPILFLGFHSEGIGAFSFGISAGVFDIGIALLLILTVVGVYLITTRKRLR
jgi:hypothetical protein